MPKPAKAIKLNPEVANLFLQVCCDLQQEGVADNPQCAAALLAAFFKLNRDPKNQGLAALHEVGEAVFKTLLAAGEFKGETEH